MTTTQEPTMQPLDIERSVVDLSTDRVQGVITGIAARWDQPYRVSDDGGQTYYHESWRQGAAGKSIRERKLFELRVGHGDHERVGRVEFYERGDGLRFEAQVEERQEKLRQDLADGNLEHVSVRYTRLKADQLRSDSIVITEAALRELSLVPQGQRAQYPDALVESVRTVDEAAQEALERRRELVARSRRAIDSARGLAL